MSPSGRRPARAAGLPACAAVVVLLTAVLLGGCGGSAAPPATGAARVVPADALAYLDVSIDPGRPPVAAGRRLAGRLPAAQRLIAQVRTRLGALFGPDSFTREAKPWLGAELAAAVVPVSARRAALVYVFAARDRRAATRFLATHPGRSGSETALVGGYVVAGPPAVLDRVRAVGAHTAPALAANPEYRRATAGAPADRVIDAYATAAGLRALLPGRGRLARALLAVLDRGDLAASNAALSATDHGGRLTVRSVLDAPASPVGFRPALPGRLPVGAALMLDVHDLRAAAPRLLATLGAAGILGRVGPLLQRLGAALHAEGVDIGAVESLFGGEAAVAVISTAGHPSLLIVARTVRPSVARLALASIEPSVAALFAPSGAGAGQAPLFTQRLIDGVTVHRLQLAPGLELDYAVFGRLIAVSTGSAAIAALAAPHRPLADDPRYRSVGGSGAGPVSSLLFLDLSQLIRLGAETGLLGGASNALASEMARIRSIGVRSTGGKNETTAELSFTIP